MARVARYRRRRPARPVIIRPSAPAGRSSRVSRVAAAAPGLRVVFPRSSTRLSLVLELRRQTFASRVIGRIEDSPADLSRHIMTSTSGGTSLIFPRIYGSYVLTLKTPSGVPIRTQVVAIPRTGKGLSYSYRARSFITARF